MSVRERPASQFRWFVLVLNEMVLLLVQVLDRNPMEHQYRLTREYEYENAEILNF